MARCVTLLVCGLCALVLMSQLQAADAKPPHVVFIIGENEYHTWETLPDFAEKELKAQGLRVSFVNASPQEGSTVFTNYTVIKEADLLLVSVRRRTPPKAMMDLIRAHLTAGKGLVGIRTASHAWDAKPADDQHASWATFDVDVLVSVVEHLVDRTTANVRAFFVCTRGDLLSGSIGRILDLPSAQAIFRVR